MHDLGEAVLYARSGGSAVHAWGSVHVFVGWGGLYIDGRLRPASAPSLRPHYKGATARTGGKHAAGCEMSSEEISAIAIQAGMSKITLMDLYRVEFLSLHIPQIIPSPLFYQPML